jgi:hypothetical protein
MSTQTTDGPLSTRATRRAAAPAGPTGDRLPVPTRQRRPALAALAVVLILGGAALAATLVLTSGQKQEYLLVNRDIAAGRTLTADDFLQQPLSATNSAIFAPVPVDDFYTRVEGKKALVAMKKGSLLSEGTFGEAITPARGLADLSLTVPEGQYPDGLAAGDIVKVVYTPKTSGQGSGEGGTSSGARPLPRGTTLVAAAYTTGVRANSSGQGGVVVTIQVKDEDLDESPNDGLPALAAANANNSITVVRLDPTHDYDKGSR